MFKDNNNPLAPRMVAAAQFEDQVWELRAKHMTYKKIAEQTGMSPRAVGYALERAQKRYNAALREKVEATLGIQLERLETLAASYQATALAGEHKSGDLYLKTLERIDKLVGLEKRAPEEVVPLAVSVNIGEWSDEKLAQYRAMKKEIERSKVEPETQGLQEPDRENVSL